VRELELINEYFTYTAIFYNSEEVAEFGAHAEESKVHIPTNGEEMTDEMRKKAIEAATKYMSGKKWDAFTMEEQRVKEWICTGKEEKNKRSDKQ
jgi:hypothetical protein